MADNNDLLAEAVHDVLNLSDLKPCPKTNATFSRLVQLIVDDTENNNNVLFLEDISRQLQKVAGAAEYQLEKFWATRVIGALKPHLEIKTFPYYENYQKLVRLELGLLLSSGFVFGSTFRVLIVGSGPLTMTSLMFYELTPSTTMTCVHNLDICKTALKISQRMNNALKMNSGFILGNGANVLLDSDHMYDVILIAALAGTTQAEKQNIIDNLVGNLNNDGRFILRSAIGVRELLYPKVQTSLLQGVQVLEEYHPNDDVINSVIVCRKN